MAMAAPVYAAVVAQQAPAISAIIPTIGFRGVPVAIQGTHFGATQVLAAGKVTFNGVDAGQALIWSDNYIVAVVPQGASSGPVVVSNLYGDSEPFQFTIYEQPETYPCYFAEGTTRPGFEEWLTVYNPWDVAYTATVTYMIAEGANRIRYYNVPAHSRINIYVNSEIGSDMDVAVSVSATARLYVERPMYFNYKQRWSDGHDTIPARETSKTWFFAEGTTRSGFEEWLCLGNPGSSDALVQVTYMFSDGDTLTIPYTVPAWKRYTIDVNATVGPERDVAIKVDSDQPLVAERPMYFNYRYGWNGGHITIGAPAAATKWFFAEGTTRSGFEEWLCFLNAGEKEAVVNLKYAFQDGSTQDQTLVLAPGRRGSVPVNEVVGPEKDVAVRVQSSEGIVAERSLYFLYHGLWDGGSNTIGSAGP
jgi:hypothetical protein